MSNDDGVARSFIDMKRSKTSVRLARFTSFFSFLFFFFSQWAWISEQASCL